MENLPLELLKRIPRGRKVTASELHTQLKDAGLDRTKRTIERQLASLSEMFDIECDSSSKPYGYRWKAQAEGVFIPGLSAQEALLLKLAKEHLSQLVPASLMSSLAPFFDQADRKLRDAHSLGQVTSRDKLSRQWLDKVKVVSTTVPMLPPKVVPGVFQSVSEALFANNWLDISYQNAQGKVSSKRVMPLGLAQQGLRMFVVCRFEGYDDNRNLALQRIKVATDTGLPFQRPADFDLQAYDDNGRFAHGNGTQIQIELWVDNSLGLLMSETPLSKDQTLATLAEPKPFGDDAPRQGHLLKATVIQSANLVWWLRSQSKALRVLAPEELVDRV
jgi:predicted DNA-binding transcriptional regulator YafY